MKKSKLRITSLCTLSPLLLSFILYPMTPQSICIHFVSDWQCDNYVNKNIGLFIAPLILMVLNLVLNKVSESDPKYSIRPYKQICQWLSPILSWIVTFIILGYSFLVS